MTPLNPAVLHDLAARCKAATGPSREIDARIFCCYASCERNFVSFDDKTRRLRYSSGSDNAWTYFCGPEYTGSLDAAMALVERRFPEAYYAIHKGCYLPRIRGLFWFEIYNPQTGDLIAHAEHDNRELAIVLCVILAEIERCGGETS